MLIEIALFVLLILLLKKFFGKPEGMPPGKWGWPLIGHVPPSNIPFREYVEQLKNKYGDIFTLKLGGRPSVVISDYDLIKTAFNKPELTGRPDYYTFRLFMFFENTGIIGSERRVWQDNRRFALTHLKDLGLGKSVLEDTIMNEVGSFMNELEKGQNKPFELSFQINLAIVNIIWKLISSKRFDINDEESIKFMGMINGELELLQGPVTYLDIYPQLEPILPKFIKNKWMKVDRLVESNDKFFDFIQKVVDEHLENLDPDDPKDYIDSYILEVQKQKDDKESTFRPDYKDLSVSIGDLFTAGSETTSTTLRYACLLLILHPEVQEKCQKEIDEVVPRDVKPSLEHRSKLVYTEAMLLEVQRKISMVPFSVPHTATQDTTLGGYSIPEGTVIMAFAEDCHNNPKYWEKPKEFYPEHFIDENGKLITKKDGFLPFSVGRRVCLGESLAKMEAFLFITSILQKYKLTEPPNEKLEFVVDKNLFLFNFIKPFNVVFTKRE